MPRAQPALSIRVARQRLQARYRSRRARTRRHLSRPLSKVALDRRRFVEWREIDAAPHDSFTNRDRALTRESLNLRRLAVSIVRFQIGKCDDVHFVGD